MSEVYELCHVCEGDGRVDEDITRAGEFVVCSRPCVWCDGEGVVPHDCIKQNEAGIIDLRDAA